MAVITARRLSLRIVITVEARRIHVDPPVLTTRKCAYTVGHALRRSSGRCTTAATVCMVTRTVCDRFKHRPQRYRSKRRRRRKKKKKTHTSVSAARLLLLLLFFRCSRCVRNVHHMHKDGLLRSYFFSTFLFWSYQSIGREFR